MQPIVIPASVPLQTRSTFIKNYQRITHQTDRLFLFAADHKIEHLDPVVPEHIFTIAQQAPIGALATQLGLIERYAHQYPDIAYIAKLNAKTNISQPQEPLSLNLWQVNEVMNLIEQKVPICGIGITVYLASEYEEYMLQQAAQTIFAAHQQGLVAIVWLYPRSPQLTKEHETELTPAIINIACALGADFVKVKLPLHNLLAEPQVKEMVASVGNTGIICAGQEIQNSVELLEHLDYYLHAGLRGVAIGRNIFERPLNEAINLCRAISMLVYEHKNLDDILAYYTKNIH